jgi:hypothetical protein
MNDVIDASAILSAALSEIYEPDTIMHAAVSVESGAFRLLDSARFFDWLIGQREAGAFDLVPLKYCEQKTELPPVGLPENEKLRSEVRGAGPIKLSINPSGQAPRRRLAYAVIVGEGLAANFSYSIQLAVDKYCNMWHAAHEGSLVLGTAVRIRCLRSVRFNEAWTVFYCEPADCVSSDQEKVAMNMIYTDPVVSFLARGADGVVRGPYIVNQEPKSAAR